MGQLHTVWKKAQDINIHSIKEEKLLLVPHKRVTPTAGHLRYSDCISLDGVATLGQA
jgi:hypothetical protein